jgi:hypothetical protein
MCHLHAFLELRSMVLIFFSPFALNHHLLLPLFFSFHHGLYTLAPVNTTHFAQRLVSLHPIQSLKYMPSKLVLLTFMSLVAYVTHLDLGLSLRPMSQKSYMSLITMP